MTTATDKRARTAESADRDAGGCPCLVPVRPPYVGRAHGGGHLPGVDPVRTGDERDHGIAIGDEDERLHDLRDITADRARRVGRGARARRKALDRDLESRRTGRLDDAGHVRVHRPIIGPVLGCADNPETTGERAKR